MICVFIHVSFLYPVFIPNENPLVASNLLPYGAKVINTFVHIATEETTQSWRIERCIIKV